MTFEEAFIKLKSGAKITKINNHGKWQENNFFLLFNKEIQRIELCRKSKKKGIHVCGTWKITQYDLYYDGWIISI